MKHRKTKQSNYLKEHATPQGQSLFYLKIASFNAIGFIGLISAAIYLDPRLASQVQFGARSYPHAQWFYLLFPVILGATYFSLSKLGSLNAKLICSWLPIAIVGPSTAFLFPPERPHFGILSGSFAIVMVSFITAWLHLTQDDLSYLQNKDLPFESRLERLKASATFWQQISIYSSAGYMAFVVTWIYVLWQLAPYIVIDRRDIFLLNSVAAFEVLIFTVFVILGPLKEAFQRAFFLTSMLSTVKREVAHGAATEL